MQFLQKTHNKTSHFVTFFGILFIFSAFCSKSESFCAFFCRFLNPHPHLQPKIKPPKNSRYTKTQLYTQKYIFLVKLFRLLPLFLKKYSFGYINTRFPHEELNQPHIKDQGWAAEGERRSGITQP